MQGLSVLHLGDEGVRPGQTPGGPPGPAQDRRGRQPRAMAAGEAQPGTALLAPVAFAVPRFSRDLDQVESVVLLIEAHQHQVGPVRAAVAEMRVVEGRVSLFPLLRAGFPHLQRRLLRIRDRVVLQRQAPRPWSKYTTRISTG